MSENSQTVTRAPLWKRIFFSELVIGASRARKLAYLGVLTAMCIIANMFLEFKMFDTQFSVTIFVSVLTGMLAGPLYGFVASFLGDFLGYVVSNWGFVYMPWVALSVSTMAFLAGMIMNCLRFKFRGGLYVKLAIICVLTFFLCTIGINSTGFYFYNKGMGFSTAVIDYVSSRFGNGVTFFGYCCYRMLFKLQILNSIFNYALLFIAVPIITSIKPLKIHLD